MKSLASEELPCKMQESRRCVVVAEHLDGSGAGVGYADSAGPGELLLHVPGLLPGERAIARVQHQSPHRKEAWAELLRRDNAAPERVVPACAAYGRCGGCVLQHLDYPAQLAYKEQQLAAALSPIGVRPAAAVAASAALGYRRRAKLVAARPAGGSGRLILGAYAPRSHTVIDMAGCQVVTPGLRAVAQTLARSADQLGFSAYDEVQGRGFLRYVLLREVASLAVQVSLVVAESGAGSESAQEASLGALVSALAAAHPRIASVVLHHNAQRGNALLDSGAESDLDAESAPDRVLLGPGHLPGHLWEEVGPLRVRVSARSFLQVNPPVAALIYADAAAQLGVRAGERILDLYCGVGGLGLTALRSAPGARLLGIEANRSAIADAQASAQAAGYADAEFLCAPVEAALPAALAPAAGAAGAGARVALLNPPRRGCSKEVLTALCQAAPRAIAYVSCNPSSLMRDLLHLLQNGYAVTQVTPYDMHPGTPHIESLALLHRRE